MSTTATPEVLPVSKGNRIEYLDILRGISILFIFIANIYFFSGWNFMGKELNETFSGSAINHAIETFTTIFVDGKFYSLFSILFGIGFAVQYTNMEKSNRPFVPFFVKRMLGLLFFGLFHIFFMWPGDILTLYALLGLVLISFRKTSNKGLLITAIILITLPILNWLLMLKVGFYPYILFSKIQEFWVAHDLPLRDWNGSGQESFDPYYMLKVESFSEFLMINLRMPSLRLGLILLEGRIFKVLALFLIGFWAGKQIMNHDLLKNVPFLRKIAMVGFSLGIPFNFLRSYSESQSGEFWDFMVYISYALGVIPMACAYAASIALLLKNGWTGLNWFAPVGRMALSNYLFHTFISLILFYGFGFGMAGKLTLWEIMLLVIPIFSWQIIFSSWWLARFKFGLMEWIWRQMTYGKYMTLKK